MFSCIDGIHFLYIVQKNPKQIFIAMHVSPNEFRQIRGEKVLSNTKLRQIRLCMPPVSFNFIGMITVFVHEFYRVVHCLVFASSLEYAFQQSDTTIVPGSIQSWIMGNSVSSSRFSTATRKHFLLSSSIPPSTHCPSTWCPLWYFLLSNLLSSIWTTFPFPPSFFRYIKKCYFAYFATETVPVHPRAYSSTTGLRNGGGT